MEHIWAVFDHRVPGFEGIINRNEFQPINRGYERRIRRAGVVFVSQPNFDAHKPRPEGNLPERAESNIDDRTILVYRGGRNGYAKPFVKHPNREFPSTRQAGQRRYGPVH